jgi:hypothetical protein
MSTLPFGRSDRDWGMSRMAMRLSRNGSLVEGRVRPLECSFEVVRALELGGSAGDGATMGASTTGSFS